MENDLNLTNSETTEILQDNDNININVISKVVDNLESTSTKDSLSANQGKILNNKIDENTNETNNLKPNLVELYNNSKVTMSNGQIITFQNKMVIGDRLTTDNTSIIVGKNVNHVRISCGGAINYTAKSGNANCYYGGYINKNDHNFEFELSLREIQSFGQVNTLKMSPSVVSVAENDKITFRAFSGSNFEMNYCWLLVEVVD